MRERMYATMYIVRNKFFPKFVRTYGTCMHHDNNYHSNKYIVPPLINFLLGYVTLIHYGLISHKVVHVDGTDGSTNWM